MGKGVTCGQCGASTPLPDDLRTPTFECAYCHRTLETAAYAGSAAVSADALLAHVGAVVRSGEVRSATDAPRFQGGDTATRAAKCLDCSGPVAVPMDLQVNQVTCAACGRTQPVSRYISDAERFALDMQRQVAGNEALRRVQAEGVPCSKCGARHRVPDDGSVQLTCTFCGATVLLSDHVDASAVARSRLKHGVFAMREELVRKQAARDRLVKWVVLGVVAVAVVGILVANLLFR